MAPRRDAACGSLVRSTGRERTPGLAITRSTARERFAEISRTDPRSIQEVISQADRFLVRGVERDRLQVLGDVASADDNSWRHVAQSRRISVLRARRSLNVATAADVAARGA